VADRPDDLRAADSDREYVAERLREALAEGRIDLTEYDERLGHAYSAKTYGELKGLLSDLPATVPADRSAVAPFQPKHPGLAVPPANYAGATPKWLAEQWSGVAGLAVLLTVIWLLSGAGSYWPLWPLGILIALNIARSFNGLMTGAPRKEVDREVRKRHERDQRRLERREQRHQEHGDSSS